MQKLVVIISKASSAVELQQAAAAMIAESGGHASALTHRLAAAGGHGRYRNNINRDVSRAFKLPLESWSQIWHVNVWPLEIL